MYRGRYAPTPSGPLHFGSLVAALASYLEARTQDGVWLLRIEDVDPLRALPGASTAILHTLAAHGFEWDGPVLYQSRRSEVYEREVMRLIDAGRVYGCRCSRKGIAMLAKTGVDGPIYPGTCRGGAAEGALRFLVPQRRIRFHDALQGQVACDVEAECGDFILKRADGVYSYQLAVVVDDASQGISHVVRGADLLTSTPRQIVLQQALAYPTPAYMHLPIALDARGLKLSKQTLAAPLDDANPLPALRQAGRFLGLAQIGQVADARRWLSTAIRLWPQAKPPALRGRKP